MEYIKRDFSTQKKKVSFFSTFSGNSLFNRNIIIYDAIKLVKNFFFAFKCPLIRF